MVAVDGHTDPATLYGKNASPTQRAADRAAYFGAGPSYAALCAKPEVFLDSYLQVPACWCCCVDACALAGLIRGPASTMWHACHAYTVGMKVCTA